MGYLLGHFPMNFFSLGNHSTELPLMDYSHGLLAGSFPNEFFFHWGITPQNSHWWKTAMGYLLGHFPMKFFSLGNHSTELPLMDYSHGLLAGR
jgi:hypothetical protein